MNKRYQMDCFDFVLLRNLYIRNLRIATRIGTATSKRLRRSKSPISKQSLFKSLIFVFFSLRWYFSDFSTQKKTEVVNKIVR